MLILPQRTLNPYIIHVKLKYCGAYLDRKDVPSTIQLANGTIHMERSSSENHVHSNVTVDFAHTGTSVTRYYVAR
jgi:hypothetical protein